MNQKEFEERIKSPAIQEMILSHQIGGVAYELSKRLNISPAGSVNRTVSRLCFYSLPLICVQISYLHTNKRSLSQAKLHNLEPISKFYSKLL